VTYGVNQNGSINVCHIGRTVLTDDGVGVLDSKSGGGRYSSDQTGKYVYVRLNGCKTTTQYNKNVVYILEVEDNTTFASVPLSPIHYNFAVPFINKEIKYHLSKNNNAMLLKKDTNKLEGIGIISSSKNGNAIIQRLDKAGYLVFLFQPKSKVKTIKNGK
jgi:hypothetical protein